MEFEWFIFFYIKNNTIWIAGVKRTQWVDETKKKGRVVQTTGFLFVNAAFLQELLFDHCTSLLCLLELPWNSWHLSSPIHQCLNIRRRGFSSVQSLSSVLLCDPMNRSMPGLPVHHQLLESTQTHVRCVGDAIQPSHPMSSPSPALNLSQHQGLFKWVSSLHQVTKALEFQLQRQSFQWTPRTDLL